MLENVNGEVRHVNKTTPHHVQVPSKRDVHAAWNELRKRLKDSPAVQVLDQYFLTR